MKLMMQSLRYVCTSALGMESACIKALYKQAKALQRSKWSYSSLFKPKVRTFSGVYVVHQGAKASLLNRKKRLFVCVRERLDHLGTTKYTIFSTFNVPENRSPSKHLTSLHDEN